MSTHSFRPFLAQLARTSKHFSNIAISILWTNVEFHLEGFHESYCELKIPPPVRKPESRKCHPYELYGPSKGTKKAEAFFGTLQILHTENPARLEHVAKRIRQICTPICAEWLPKLPDSLEITHPNAIRVWELLPYMTNLESLELHGIEYHYHMEKAEEPVQEIKGPTPRLRFAKLSGYMVAAVLKAGATLERLELGMLDRPISAYHSSDPAYLPLPHEKIKKEKDDDNREADSDDNDDEADSDSDESESDWGSLKGDAIIPRPLGGYLPSNHNELKLPKLTHLHLYQPSESDYEDSCHVYNWSTRAEKACHSDWRQILQASLPTLKTFVLEQRPTADVMDVHYNPIDEKGWMESRTIPEASLNLLNMVKEVLEEADKSQVSLQRVYLYGIYVGGPGENGMADPEEPEGWFLKFLQGYGVGCEARFGKWCFFDDELGTTVWESWYGADTIYSEVEETGDFVMCWDDAMYIAKEKALL
ncbi:hypothetical protein HYE68_002568 [Fusarium pseudograminearum]|nr:hypothetical protein HYE68_002568 [Fusarium pseudograminearum]